jgi:hypothetical protein
MKTKRKYNNKLRKHRITKKIKRRNKTKKYNKNKKYYKKGSGPKDIYKSTPVVARNAYKIIGPSIGTYIPSLAYDTTQKEIPKDYRNVSEMARRNYEILQSNKLNSELENRKKLGLSEIQNRYNYNTPPPQKTNIDVNKIISESLTQPASPIPPLFIPGLRNYKEPREIMKRGPSDILKYVDQQDYSKEDYKEDYSKEDKKDNFNKKTNNDQQGYSKEDYKEDYSKEDKKDNSNKKTNNDPNFTFINEIHEEIIKALKKTLAAKNPFKLTNDEEKIITVSEIFGIKDWIEKKTGKKIYLKPTSTTVGDAVTSGLIDICVAIVSIAVTKLLINIGLVDAKDLMEELDENIKEEIESLPVNEETKKIILDKTIKIVKDNEDFFKDEFSEADFFAKNSKPTDLETINSLKKRYFEIPEENEEERKQLRDYLDKEVTLYQAKYNENP